MRIAILLPFLFLSSFLREKANNNGDNIKEVFAEANAMIQEGANLVKNGDIVLRCHQDFSSMFIKNFNREDKSYSHSGIVFIENGYPFVYHMIPGDENPGGKMRKDSLCRFCDPKRNAGYGIFRYDINDRERGQLQNIVHQWYHQQIGFDMLFDLKSDTLMYCSEMVKKAVERSTRQRIRVNTTKLNSLEAQLFSMKMHIPAARAKNLEVVAPDNLYLNQHCTVVRRFIFFK